MFPFEDFFHPGKQTNKQTNKRCSGQDPLNRECGARGSRYFCSKTTERSGTGALINHPLWNVQMHWKKASKNSLMPNATSHNNASWYSDTDMFLEHSPSGGSLYYKGPTLQKIVLGFFVPPLCMTPITTHLDIYPREMKTCLHKNLCVNIRSSFIHNSKTRKQPSHLFLKEYFGVGWRDAEKRHTTVIE